MTPFPQRLNPIDAVAQSRAVRHLGKLIGLAAAVAIRARVTQRRVTAEVVEVQAVQVTAADRLRQPVKAMTAARVTGVVLAAVAVVQVQPVGKPEAGWAVRGGRE